MPLDAVLVVVGVVGEGDGGFGTAPARPPIGQRNNARATHHVSMSVRVVRGIAERALAGDLSACYR
jgi:hypothetical protein